MNEITYEMLLEMYPKKVIENHSIIHLIIFKYIYDYINYELKQIEKKYPYIKNTSIKYIISDREVFYKLAYIYFDRNNIRNQVNLFIKQNEDTLDIVNYGTTENVLLNIFEKYNIKKVKDDTYVLNLRKYFMEFRDLTFVEAINYYLYTTIDLAYEIQKMYGSKYLPKRLEMESLRKVLIN